MTNGVMEIHESEYNEILQRCVAVISGARKMLARQVASTASDTYWEIGKLLHERKLDSKHGSSVVKLLSIDLKKQFPDIGLSPRNLWDMKRFYERYKDADEKLRRSVALLPWKHNMLIIGKGLDDKASLYYAEEDIAKGWNRDLLLNAIKMEMHKNTAAIPIENYYLSLLDRLERQPDENRSIGIILCAEKDRVEVELALEDMGKPIGVADYQLIIPKDDLQKVITDEIKQFDINNRVKEDEV